MFLHVLVNHVMYQQGDLQVYKLKYWSSYDLRIVFSLQFKK